MPSILRKFFKSMGLSPPPEPEELVDTLRGVVEGVRQAKDIPQELMGRATEAEEDFRSADRLFRGSRFKGGSK